MPMAIVLSFDPAADGHIRAIWKRLADAGLGDPVPALEAEGPHLSLAVFESGDKELLGSRIKALADKFEPIKIQFDAVSVFPGQSHVLFLPATVSRPLLDLHQACHTKIQALVKDWHPYYLPEQLLFHCTLAMGLDQGQIQTALGLAGGMGLLWHGPRRAGTPAA